MTTVITCLLLFAFIVYVAVISCLTYTWKELREISLLQLVLFAIVMIMVFPLVLKGEDLEPAPRHRR